MYSVANGNIRRLFPFRRVYVQSAAGDAGGATGAAFAVSARAEGGRSFVMDHGYWDPSFGREDIARLLTAAHSRIAEAACGCEEIAQRTQLCRRAAAAITDGKVVGWFQGRMEWGPRALGDLSIVCDPRRGT
jgi:carbamoyltransferase